ncbi:MAG: hypothetical protein IPH12_06135 [Saprospirales bacterium]|nr:hypothetical protein [Saprospirales bacterium]MBK8923174.1 hypothetical protein [Saprospirales bacterium]
MKNKRTVVAIKSQKVAYFGTSGSIEPPAGGAAGFGVDQVAALVIVVGRPPLLDICYICLQNLPIACFLMICHHISLLIANLKIYV